MRSTLSSLITVVPLSFSTACLLLRSHQRLRRKPQARATRPIKNHKLALEEDIPKDIQADALTRLNAAEARRPAVVDRSVVDVRAGDRGLVAADLEADVRQGGAAGVGVAALGLVELGAADGFVVCGYDGVVDEQQGGARVGDGVDAVAVDGAVAYGVARGSKGPKALGTVDGNVGDVAGVCAVVDGAKAVGARLALLQVDGEKRGREAGFDIVEKGELLGGLDCIDGGEGQAEEAVVTGVLLKLSANFFGEFDGLADEGRGADSYGVGVNIAARRATIAVGDVPGRAAEGFGGVGLGWIVGVMAVNFVTGGLGGKDPALDPSVWTFS